MSREKDKNYSLSDLGPLLAMEPEAAYYTPERSVKISRSGITTSFVEDLMQKYVFSKADLARLIDVSPKTIDRHMAAGKLFTGLQAERLLRLAELYAQGVRVFGKGEKFIKWLNSTIVALDHTTPMSWLDTYHGIQLISDELGRIEHGIFA